MESRWTWVVVLLLLGSCSMVLADVCETSYKVVCYLGSWANYRTGEGKFLIEDIDPFLCTHLIYAFAKLSYDNKIVPYDPYLDLKENWGLGAYDRFTGLKKKNPNLKTLLAIGGWNEGSTKYSQMVKTPESRKVFMDSCIELLEKHGFDGLDLDWEYPANRGGAPEDKTNFVLLLKELKEAFSKRGLLLTAAVGAGESTINSAYDVPALSKYLDFINIMTYDFYGGWDTITGHHAPLYTRPQEPENRKNLSVDYAVKQWLAKGAAPEKLILGMPLYGRSFSLQDPQKNGLGVPVTGKGTAGEFTREAGFVGYNEICKMLRRENGWNVVVDKYTQAPYAFKDRQWVGFDNIKSISIKVEYLKKMNLGGGMVWSIETDDFCGLCHGKRYPLLRAINDGLNRPYKQLPPPEEDPTKDNTISSTKNVYFSLPTSASPESTSSSRRTTWIFKSSTEAPSGDELFCPFTGYFRHPLNCKQFYYCQPRNLLNKSLGYEIYVFRCAPGTVFSEELRTCTFPYNAPEC